MSLSMISSMNTLDKNNNDEIVVQKIIEKSVSAQKEIESWSDEKIDELIESIAESFNKNRSYFAEREVEETGIGNIVDKDHKLSLVSDIIANELKGVKAIGRLKPLTEHSIEYASPVGVIFGIIPMTNPVPNSLFKTLLSIKTRNSLIVSYPRAVTKLGVECIDIIQSVLKKHNAPIHLIQCVPVPVSRERSALFMTHKNVNLILATGGSSLVQSAYRSGTPAYGVGPGNVPVIVSESANLAKASQDIIKGKSYDNGIVCGSESNLIVSNRIYEKFISYIEKSGGAVLNKDEAIRVAEILFDPETKRLKRDYIGVSGEVLAEQTSITRDWPIKVLLMPVNLNNISYYSREKMAPVLTLLSVEQEQAIETAKMMLLDDGAGHTAVIHSQNKEEIENFALEIPVGRLLVNTPATHGMLGDTTDLGRTFMAGCGTWGGNISTEGITWRHLVNIKTLAYDTQSS
ncbi:aldehyde dehydrogenase family protein [Aliikangiella sp. IMCC44359]|uniref:aldehyde dehydrogenase family protein n=1 Tax=Aliikangiella sp. IMCC44359 TaxID=3459125 RepID=UPI00403ADE22